MSIYPYRQIEIWSYVDGWLAEEFEGFTLKFFGRRLRARAAGGGAKFRLRGLRHDAPCDRMGAFCDEGGTGHGQA